MNWFLLTPDCIGLDGHLLKTESGENVLHVIAELPADSELLQSGGCIIATSSLIAGLQRAALSGFHVDECIVTLGEQFMDVYPAHYPLPELRRLIIDGTPFKDDFALDENDNPIVSDSVIRTLNKHRYNHSDTVILFGGDAAEHLIAHRRSSYT